MKGCSGPTFARGQYFPFQVNVATSLARFPPCSCTNSALSLQVAVELGGYCGYSAVRFASQLAEDAIYISIEMSSTHAAVARQVVEHAGLSHKVKIVVDETEIVLNNFKNRTGRAKIDFLFIDHEKKLYLRDIKTIVDKDLLESGAMVVADNVITPGAPDYLAWMRANLSFKSQLRKTKQAYNRDGEDGLEVSVYH